MNFRRLKYYVKIVDIGSLTQAAAVLHIAQPALSQQIATLEGELNQQLLIRTRRGVTPTEAGQVLYDHACAILRQCEQAYLAVNSQGQVLRGQVTLGFAPGTAGLTLTTSLLQAVRKELPEVQIHLLEANDRELNERLVAGQLDMAVLYGRTEYAGVISQPLRKEALFLVGIQNCPGQHVDLMTVAQGHLLLPRNDSAVRKRIDEAFALRRLSANIIGEIESMATLQTAIASGMGASVLPESAAHSVAAATRGWMARITSPDLSLSIALNMSAHRPQTPASQAVKALLMSLVARPVHDRRELMLVS